MNHPLTRTAVDIPRFLALYAAPPLLGVRIFFPPAVNPTIEMWPDLHHVCNHSVQVLGHPAVKFITSDALVALSARR
jgi:hypothetical protein